MLPKIIQASDRIKQSPHYRECPECGFWVCSNKFNPDKCDILMDEHLEKEHGIITLKNGE